MGENTTYLIDTTLRDGEQAPGVAFTIDEKLNVASQLDALCIDEVEIGTPAIGKQEQEAIQIISTAGFSFKTSSWCRAKIDDLKIAAQLETTSVNISLPVSDLQIEALGKNRAWVLNELKSVLSFARQNFSFVTMGAQDASRADMHFLKEFVFFALENGANRIRINDTVGILDSLETKELIGDLAWHFPQKEFEFHGHNDFGMATANAIAALKAGAKCVSGTINGLGERAGNTVLEEVIAYLKVSKGVDKYNTQMLSQLSKYVAHISGRTLADAKPVTGDQTFNHESGVHTSAMLRNPKTYQIIDPSDFGSSKTAFVYGKHSGRAALVSFFNSKGFALADNQVNAILDLLEKSALNQKCTYAEEELIDLLRFLPVPSK